MSQLGNPYQAFGTRADAADVDARGRFLRLTYLNLGGAVLAFLALESVLLNLPQTPQLVRLMIGGRFFSWFIVLGAFMAVSYVAERMAQTATKLSSQYIGLGLYVVAQAVIFVPLMYMAATFGGKDVIPIAGLLTLVIFGGLTGIVLLTGANFSFLRTGLTIGGFAALGVIVASAIFGFNLGLIFTAAMILLAAGYILYYTSQVMHQYRTDQYVAASLALFASVALLFWYILQLVMSLQSRD